MEIFLYNWWPLAADRRLYDRLARMPGTVDTTAADVTAPQVDSTQPTLAAQHGR